MRRLILLFMVLVICWAGCKKDSSHDSSGNNSGIQIKIVNGANQRDTVGNLLSDSIIVKVTDNGTPVKNYTVQFRRSGCEDLKIAEKTLSSSGSAEYSWYLSGETGTQWLNIIVLDDNGNKKDSTAVKATGIAATHGWHRSGCVQNFPVNSFSKLGSGRIVTSLNRADYPYYSDDNAASWHPLRAFSANYFITKVVTIGTANEVFLATQNSGIFYSANAGQSWVNRISGITDPTGFSDMTYTKKGKLIFCTGNGVYLSTDKGVSWTDIGFDLPDGQSYNPCEQLNGDLYIIASDAELYKSTNSGTTWVNQGSSKGNYLLASVESLYIDDKGYMYIGIPHNGAGTNGEIHKSTDQGKTWTSVFAKGPVQSSFPNVTQINKLNGNYYFSFAGRGVYETADFSTYRNITSRFAAYGLLSYTVANNSSFVIGSPGFGVFYYVQ